MTVRYGQHCPVARATEVLGDSWTILIVRELLHGPASPAEFGQDLPGVSPSVLAARLRRLSEAGLVESRDDGCYELTEAGRELAPVIDQLGHWGRRWLPPPLTRELRPRLVLRDICRHVRRDRLPAGPVAIRIVFAEVAPPRQWWLVLSEHGASAGTAAPGIPAALRIDCTLPALARVWLGHTGWLDAVREHTIRFTGPSEAVREVLACLGTSPYASHLRAVPG